MEIEGLPGSRITARGFKFDDHYDLEIDITMPSGEKNYFMERIDRVELIADDNIGI